MVSSSPAWPGWSRKNLPEGELAPSSQVTCLLSHELALPPSDYLNKSDKHWGQVAGAPGGHSHSLRLAWSGCVGVRWAKGTLEDGWATFGFLQIPPRGQAAGPEEAGLSAQGDPHG